MPAPTSTTSIPPTESLAASLQALSLQSSTDFLATALRNLSLRSTMSNASTKRVDFEKMDIYILVPKHSTPHPTQWVLYRGPYMDTADRRSEERNIFFLIKKSTATNKLTFDFRIQGMPTHFTLGDWKTRRLITSEMAESTEDMARLTEAVTWAVEFPDEVD